FGFGTSPSRATRMTATLKTIGANTYTFKLGVKAAGQLFVNGTKVVDLPTDVGHFQEGIGTITVTQSTLAIEIRMFDNGNPEVQLSYAVGGGEVGLLTAAAAGAGPELKIIEPDELTPTIVPYQTTSAADGSFSIPAVPTTLGSVGVNVTATIGGRTKHRVTQPIAPVPGGITDFGVVRVDDFGTLYVAAFSGPTGSPL